MPSFGRRGIVPSAATSTPPSVERAAPEGAWGFLKLATALGFSLMLLGLNLQQDERGRALADYTPNARYDIGSAWVDPACPQRRWSVGEYLPQTCFVGQVLRDVTPIGLENSWSGRRDIRHFHWVRTTADVVLVDCPSLSGPCRIWRVVRDRLAHPSPPALEPTDHAVYARPSLSYILGAAFGMLGGAAMPLMLIIMIAVWLYRQAGAREAIAA